MNGERDRGPCDICDPDIGKCDECGEEEGTRRRVPYHGVMAWLCPTCRTTLALLDAMKGRAS